MPSPEYKDTEATPLTEEEREALRIARHAHTAECLGRSLASPRRSDFDAGFIAAKTFYSERERALREALTKPERREGGARSARSALEATDD